VDSQIFSDTLTLGVSFPKADCCNRSDFGSLEHLSAKGVGRSGSSRTIQGFVGNFRSLIHTKRFTTPDNSMEKWYVSKAFLNTLLIVMAVGFLAYFLRKPAQIQQLGLVIFLTAGTLIMVRGVIKITMGMRQK
jgi:hypothetical protein